jgi:hypothetical protein
LAHAHQPDPQVIADFFERLFSHVTIDGQIEIAYTLPDSKAPKQARMFKVEDYAEAADFAAQINATPGQNVYFGPAIRRPNQPHSRGVTPMSSHYIPYSPTSMMTGPARQPPLK